MIALVKSQDNTSSRLACLCRISSFLLIKWNLCDWGTTSRVVVFNTITSAIRRGDWVDGFFRFFDVSYSVRWILISGFCNALLPYSTACCEKSISQPNESSEATHFFYRHREDNFNDMMRKESCLWQLTSSLTVFTSFINLYKAFLTWLYYLER
jgi:hypothetical protein